MPIDEDTSHGARVRAGRLLSQYINKIAMEETEMVQRPDEGDVMATKAEALARTIWKNALGYMEHMQDVIGGKLIERDVKIRPSLAYINLIYERMEGKAGPTTGDDSDKPTVADKVTKQGVERINSVGSLPSE